MYERDGRLDQLPYNLHEEIEMAAQPWRIPDPCRHDLLTLMRRGQPAWTYSLFLVLPSLGQGFQNPGTFMSILVVSEQKEQAVVSSMLILWRSLGMVLGVASSSLVVQNALVHYIDKFVVGPEKDEVDSTSLFLVASNPFLSTTKCPVANELLSAKKVIVQVRKSVHAILSPSPEYKEQVQNVYTAVLKVIFRWQCFWLWES